MDKKDLGDFLGFLRTDKKVRGKFLNLFVEDKEFREKLTRLQRVDNAVLIANPDSNAWDFAKKIQSYILNNKKYAIPLERVEIKKFNNGEFRMQVMANVRKKDAYFIHDSTEDPTKWLIQAQCMDDLLFRASVDSTTFVFTDYLWGRQDTKDRPHTHISARRNADSLIHVSRVITMETHAKQIQGFFNCPIDVLKSYPVIIEYLKSPETGIENLSEWIISSTDAGSATLAEDYCNLLRCKDLVVAHKKRDRTGKIERVVISGEVKGEKVLVFDDMDDSGGTKIKVGKELHKKGAVSLISISTHGLYTNGVEEMLETYDRVITTDTHNNPHLVDSGIEVVQTYPLFGFAISNSLTGDSISEIFEPPHNNH